MPTVFITVPPTAATDVVETLLEERLAACVNRIETRSSYRWDGEVVHDEEEILLVKTSDDAYDDLVARVEEIHPYEVPCIERFEESHVLESFATWRAEALE
ncbi:divalent-cation tolerance protein CutA [Natronobiforma cellulositropha]|uniref:divalent-cation tolerance protein CutA n=1 Tax=Natronobiforma cellulositropha TaxID=1679076 RepID=UPI0021D59DD6|nr:divalent-cation tolerance protein CutA [Natronobiforma cellulositropha]